jgi:GAF domain-containing protein
MQFPLRDILHLLGTSMPLLFIVVAFYTEDRFVFFDLFIKRGLALLSTLTLLGLTLALAFRIFGELAPDTRTWVFAVVLLPLAMALPWLTRKLGSVLDNLWLGRRYGPTEAIKEFLGGLPSATDEAELVRRAEAGLSRIFNAPVRIDLELRTAPPLEFDCLLDIPIRTETRQVGAILLGRRSTPAPYFSEDIALLDSLADVFSYMLQNVRLQAKKQEQEQRARELSLQASRSELKALRAQINPHFLFNALNAIAGLIHKDPMRADATVEKLAEVFRYTLRRSESEWTLLEDELEFVQAYLEVEQARFGTRLGFEVVVDPRARSLRVPAMMVQTLTENAVKHGVARVRGDARIVVRARLEPEELFVEVADSGAGFDDARGGDDGEGFGLKSVRQRLRGHFGDEGRLTVRRDAEEGMTVVSLSMPRAGLEAERRVEAAGGSDSQGAA